MPELSELVTNLFSLVLDQLDQSQKDQNVAQLQKSKSYVDHDISMRLLKEICDNMLGVMTRFLDDVLLFDKEHKVCHEDSVKDALRQIESGEYKSIGDLLGASPESKV